MPSSLSDMIQRSIAEHSSREEEVVRVLLARWVSELEPVLVYHRSEIIGLTFAGVPIGSEPPILRRDDL